jgi:release factor glutamine methyltransferase
LLNIKAVIDEGSLYLKEISDSPKLDAQLLLCNVLNIDRVSLFLRYEKEIDELMKARFDALLERRRLQEPLNYIIGKREFYSNDFLVNHDVLIPRPETELIIDVAKKYIDKDIKNIIDIGTGSGVIAITLKLIFPNINITASDISEDALKIAKRNAEIHKVKLDFVISDALQNIQNNFQMIVTNPPYVKSSFIEDDLSLAYEPRRALDGGESGLEVIKKILEEAKEKIDTGGLIIMEHGFDQAEDVKSIAKKYNFDYLCNIKDINDHPRVSILKWN